MMARIRSIKPEFPHSESMGEISRDARLTFILLWTLADDSGRLRGNSRMLASLLYPYDNDAPELIDGWLCELESQRCLVRYKADGSSYIQIYNWLIHQKIDKPSKSKIPPFDESSRILGESSRSFVVGSKDLRIKGSKDQGEDLSPPSPSAQVPPSASLQAKSPAESEELTGRNPENDLNGDLFAEDAPANASGTRQIAPGSTITPSEPSSLLQGSENSTKAVLSGFGDQAEIGKAKRAVAAVRPDDVPEDVWNDFKAMRQAKKAPLTQTAMNIIKEQAEKAGMNLPDVLSMCCANGWQGFNADWVRNKSNQNNGRRMPPAESFNDNDYGTEIMPL